jgi:hypothetical protein
MQSISGNAPNDTASQHMNKSFVFTEVVLQQLAQPFIRTKNDIGSDG